MKKIQSSAAVFVTALMLAAPLFAGAQTYSNQYSYTTTNSCIALTQYLRLSSSDAYTGGQVTMLQQFLNRTGYLSGVTGYFDQGTYGAVVNYQREHGISSTGTVGPLTRAVINQQSCNGSNSNSGSNSNNNSYGPISISSLSSTSGNSGSYITIYGTNLSNGNTVVHFGGSTVPFSSATNSQITFTVPSYSTGTYQVYVSNSYGSSNSLTFSLNSNGSSNSNCNYINGSYQCNNCSYSNNSNYNNYNYSYSNCNNSNNNSNMYGSGDQPRISSVSGLGSTPTGNSNTWSVTAYSTRSLPVTVSVDWGDGSSQQTSQSYNYNSGQQQTYPFSHVYTNSGMYTMRFTATDSSGQYAYSTQLVSVTGNGNYYNYNNGYTPSISYLSQTSATRGSTITIFGSNFTSNNTVMFGGSSYSASSYNNGTSISFTLPYFSYGNYGISVTNSNGQTSNSVNVTLQ